MAVTAARRRISNAIRARFWFSVRHTKLYGISTGPNLHAARSPLAALGVRRAGDLIQVRTDARHLSGALALDLDRAGAVQVCVRAITWRSMTDPSRCT